MAIGLLTTRIISFNEQDNEELLALNLDLLDEQREHARLRTIICQQQLFMAIRFSPKLRKNLRCFNSSSSIAFMGKPERSVLKPPTSPIDDLNFDNGEQLFSSVMRSRLMENKYFRGMLMGIIKRSIYEHFCAGEDLEEASRTLQRLWDNGLRGILDYGLEDATDNEGCDRNLEEFLKTVETTSLLPPSSVRFACVKITAICPISLLERISDLLRWERTDPSFHLPWKIESLPFLSNSSPLYHTTSKPEPLTEKEEEDLKLAQQRLSKLCEKCHQTNLPLLVDAEYTLVQPAIDYFTYSAAIRFNEDENTIVYGTI
ncbi:proline dehydrogenase 1, mitochondrial-like [Magnolia sinica]|uniref:proline dehydrogenase 1, mitochondrial-like n=1 Tax=Magnolia sinica TaxID=86752 RepID=UPI002657E111|nr:proline dehydrogenase 1, mitochondrial-like [Magnolia sinica]